MYMKLSLRRSEVKFALNFYHGDIVINAVVVYMIDDLNDAESLFKLFESVLEALMNN